MIEAKSDLIEEYIKQSNDLVVMFGSHECMRCTDFIKYEMDKLEQSYPNTSFMFMDGNKMENSADLYEIEYFPTFLRFKNQKLIGNIHSSDPVTIIKKLKLSNG